MKCDGFETYADSTLKGMAKYELVLIIRTLEHNLRVAKETNNRQYKMLARIDSVLRGEVK